MTVSSGKSIAQVAKDLDASLNTLHSWRQQSRGERRLPVAENETPEQTIKRLERELRMVTEERDIIKKAIAALHSPRLLSDWAVTPCMSGRGNCYDNAVRESFFATLRKELIHRVRYATHDARASSDTSMCSTTASTCTRCSTTERPWRS